MRMMLMMEIMMLNVMSIIIMMTTMIIIIGCGREIPAVDLYFMVSEIMMDVNAAPCWTKLQRFINSCKVNSSEVNLGCGLFIGGEHPREVWRSLVYITFPDCEI